jgi:hypothetical protein
MSLNDPHFNPYYQPKGETIFSQVFCTGLGPVMQIDWYEGNHINVGISNIETPMCKLYSITLFNDGPGPIQFHTNKARGSREAGMILNANENIEITTPIVYGAPTYQPKLERLNICAPTSGSASVRVMGVI